MALDPYYDEDGITIYHGDCRDVLPMLAPLAADLVVADPPYGETSLVWDRWPCGWVEIVSQTSAKSMWCFGSARMFDEHHDDFRGWRMSQDLIWDKGTAATGMVTDRFLRSHEHIRHYYHGAWSDVHHEAQRIAVPWSTPGRRVWKDAIASAWHGDRGAVGWEDDGRRLMLSVLPVPNLVKSALHPTEKPAGVLVPLVLYGCPVGGLVVDPTSGSGSTLHVARDLGRRAIGIEIDERYCEIAAKRLAQGVLAFGA